MAGPDPTNSETSVVWFKRDLRVFDHLPLTLAAERGPVLCLYVYEPELLASPEWDSAHSVFIDQCLEALDAALQARGARLTYRAGNLPDVLEALHRHHAFTTLYSHLETGNDLTYRRDRRVNKWARDRGVIWIEKPQTGVVRPLKRRDGWARSWERRMNAPLLPAPDRIVGVAAAPEGRRTLAELGLSPNTKAEAQAGGEPTAQRTLKSFLTERGVDYRSAMSSPLTGWDSCSRLSPYIAWGALSLKHVFQAARRQQENLRLARHHRRPDLDPRWLESLTSFHSRLRWHCHFMQKLEDQPAIEFHNMNRTYDGLRENAWNEDFFQAWCHGRTGYPLVDACMRCVQATGWLNFRMRAMVMSFASYHLWLHWRPTAVHLARHFLDFEPGIHFSQVQMQAGVTGINTVRIYSPRKQVLDQDPQGEFIRRWVPELAGVPTSFIAEPHRMPIDMQLRVGCRIGHDYPAPVVVHEKAYHEARRRLATVRGTPDERHAAQRVFQRHGSRRGSPQRRAPSRQRRLRF